MNKANLSQMDHVVAKSRNKSSFEGIIIINRTGRDDRATKAIHPYIMLRLHASNKHYGHLHITGFYHGAFASDYR